MRPKARVVRYGKVNPPVWECVAFRGFLLAREHLDRLLEIRRLREEIDPEMRYSVLFDTNDKVVRNPDGTPKRGSQVQIPRQAGVQAFSLSAVSWSPVAVPANQPEPASGLSVEQIKELRRRRDRAERLVDGLCTLEDLQAAVDELRKSFLASKTNPQS